MTFDKADVREASPVRRLTLTVRRYKILLFLGLVFAAGVAGILLSDSRILSGAWAPVRNFPFLAVGEAFVSAAIIGLAYEWFVRREANDVLQEALDSAIARHDEEIEKRLVVNDYTDYASLARLTLDFRERAVRNSLLALTENAGVARELTELLVPQLTASRDFWRDVRWDIDLDEDDSGFLGSDAYLNFSATCEYEARLDGRVFRVRLDGGRATSLGLIDAKADVDFAWTFGATNLYNWTDPEHFAVGALRIDHEDIPMTREVVDNQAGVPSQIVYSGATSRLEDLAKSGRPVHHHIAIHGKVAKRGHFVTVPLIRTAVGFRVTARSVASEEGIHQLSLLPHLFSGGAVSPKYSRSGSRITAFVATERCVFAGGGLVVHWNLEGEYAETFNFRSLPPHMNRV